ncbi:acyl carrier protein [Streptomyces collinus]|uniref:acyl carrier protein n=1 Tax=Streptomyces collinus TaxID=42684 RepID=UPI00368128E6
MSTPDSEAMEAVIDFLRKCNRSVDTIDWDSDLIDARILDSLTFVEFLLLMEEFSGGPIDLGTTDVANFRTLNRISAFLTKAGTHEQP